MTIEPVKELEEILQHLYNFEREHGKELFIDKFIQDNPDQETSAKVILLDHNRLLNFKRYEASYSLLDMIRFDLVPEEYGNYHVLLNAGDFLREFLPTYKQQSLSLAQGIEDISKIRKKIPEQVIRSYLDFVIDLTYNDRQDYLNFIENTFRANQSTDDIAHFQIKFTLRRGMPVFKENMLFLQSYESIKKIRDRYKDVLTEHLKSPQERVRERSYRKVMTEFALDITSKGFKILNEHCSSKGYEDKDKLALQAIHFIVFGFELGEQSYTVNEMLDQIVSNPAYGRELLKLSESTGKQEMKDILFTMAFDRGYATKMQGIYENEIKPLIKPLLH
nr:hypothetical protein [Candidatus Woesearchaeota archaeon]